MKRFLFVLILMGLGLYFLWPQTLKLLERAQGPSELSRKISASRTSTGYVLREREWTTFPLPAMGRLIKVVTSATLPPGVEATPDVTWKYALAYELMDDQNKILIRRTYHLHTRLTQYYEKDPDKPFHASFYLDSNKIPADERVTMIPISEEKEVASIRFRIVSKDPSVLDVVLRAYMQEVTPEKKIGYLWHRLNRAQKERLAKGNVYPHDLLSEPEKRNLLRKPWRPLGPFGVEGKGYHVRTLYILKEVEGERIEEALLPRGLFADRLHRAIIPLPEGGGEVRLAFMEAGDGQKKPEETIRINWFGKRPDQRSTRQVPWEGGDSSFQGVFGGGLLEVQSPGDMVIRAYLLTNGVETEITPQPLLVRNFLIQPNAPISYGVTHARQKATPFKVNLRYFPSGTAGEDVPLVRYQILTTSGTILKEGTLPLEPSVSRYDRVVGDITGMTVSDPTPFYFSLPARAAVIRFTASSDILVSAYTRPMGLSKVTRVPEDYYRYDGGAGQGASQGMGEGTVGRLPAWFPKNPRDVMGLIREGRSPLLNVQYRPPEDRPDLLAGRYHWESFLPKGPQQARYLFAPREGPPASRKEILPTLYHQIGTRAQTTLTVETVKGLRTVNPRLIYFRKGSRPVSLDIFVDGGPYYRGRILGKQGELRLPPLSVGKHRFKVTVPGDVALFLNHTPSGKRPHLLRLAQKFDKSGLRFRYEKKSRGEDLLLVNYFSLSGKQDETDITVTVQGKRTRSPGPFRQWTLLDRKYLVEPDPRKPIPVLHTRGKRVDRARVFFLPLGSDLPPGSYDIRFSLRKGPGGYVIFSKTTPGLFEKRKFYWEP